MAYMRGDHYIWRDSDNFIHVWVRDGYDGWDACYEGEEEGSRRPGWANASGVSLSLDVMDEFVVMRLAQLLRDGRVCAAIDRVVGTDSTNAGNFGASDLVQNAAKLKAALSQIRLDEPEQSEA